MRYLPSVVKSAPGDARRFVLTVITPAVSPSMFCTPMTVLTEVECNDPGEIAR